MKIAHIASIYDTVSEEIGGRCRLIYLLARMQQKQGHQVTVFARKDSRIEGCRTVSPSKVKEVPTPRRISGWLWRRGIESINYAQSYRWIGKSFDIVHNHLFEEASIVGRLCKCPSVTTIHGGAPADPLHTLLMRLYGVANTTGLIAISGYAYQVWKKLIPKTLIGYVYNCIEPNYFPFVSKSPSINEFQLCFVGRCVPEKGCHLAIRAVDMLNKIGYPSRLYMAVAPYGYSAYFERITRMAKERPYVELEVLPENQRLFERVSNSDVMLFPILSPESFGYAMVESMACGTPVIAFPCGSPSEIIQDGVTGFLCNDLNDMVKAVLKVRELDRRKCKELVENAFSVKATYEDYMRLYQRVSDSI